MIKGVDVPRNQIYEIDTYDFLQTFLEEENFEIL